MRIRLEKPKKENSLVVLLSVQVSPAQLGKMQLKKQINKQTKKPTPTKIFFFFEKCFYNLDQSESWNTAFTINAGLPQTIADGLEGWWK